MPGILILARKWVRSYRVLRNVKAFDFVAAVRYGLWLAAG
jgi:acyl-CoA hydrolase